MSIDSDKLKEQFERALERSAARLAVLEALPDEDPYEDGQVLRIARSYGSSKVYTYAALKIQGRWWLTGERHVRYGSNRNPDYDRASSILGPSISWDLLRAWIVESGNPQQLRIDELEAGRQVV